MVSVELERNDRPNGLRKGALLERGDQRGGGGTVMVILMLMTADRRIMGDLPVRGWLRGLGWLSTAAMLACVLGMFAGWFMGSG